MERPFKVAVLIAVAGLGAGSALPDSSGTPIAHVVYLTEEAVYIDAGSGAGLALGDRVLVRRDGRTVEVLEVMFLASSHAACRPLTGKEPVAVGDTVVLRPDPSAVALPDKAVEPPAGVPEATPAPPARSVPPPPRPAETPRRRRRLRELGLRGRVGVRFLAIRDRAGGGAGFTQPALDLRLEGRRVAGTPYDVSADIRARRTYRGSADGGGALSRTRVYRFSATWNAPGTPVRVTAGRQFSTAVATVSIFDGILARYDAERWATGVFSGTQPDPQDFGFSTAIREHGAFFQFRAAPRDPVRWSVTTGLIGSYEHGSINREFLYVQGSATSPRWSLYATQEIDVNRGWKASAGERALSPTNTFVTARYRIADGLSIDAGYDDRRNVRLYRDRVTPETEFDDSHRRGVWLGGSWRFLGRYRISLTGRESRGGSAGRARSYTASLSATGLGRWRTTARARASRYQNALAAGWLASLSAGMDLGDRWHVEFEGGAETRDDLVGFTGDETLVWYSADIDAALGRSWYLLLSLERNEGSIEKNDQLYASLAYRF